MTNEEAIAVLRANYPEARYYLRQAVDVAIDALKRQVPKKVIMGGCCPNCGSRGYTETGLDDADYALLFCNNCGQRLDWS